MSNLTRLDLYTRVQADPRVQAARKAFNAFSASEAGRAINEACRGFDWQERLRALDEDVRVRHDAHQENYHRTMVTVRGELLAAMEPVR